jgi:putative N-acetylmannosamine-6-phosphate epimerase
MNRQVKIGGKNRPIRFDMAALYIYEEQTGRSALSDMATFAQGAPSVRVMVDLVHAGLIRGASYFRQTFEADKYLVAEWLTTSQDILPEVMKMFEQSFNSGEASEEEKNVSGPTPEA